MRPSPQFKSAVLGLLQNAPSTITNQDITKHNNQDVIYYIISRMKYRNGQMVSATQPFDDSYIITIKRRAESLKVQFDIQPYMRTSEIELLSHQGKNFLAWVAEGAFDIPATIVKIISPDGVTQIKIISQDQTEQQIFNVCELPSHLISQL